MWLRRQELNLDLLSITTTIGATVVGWDAERNVVLAGDLKCLVYYIISKLNRNIPHQENRT